MTKLFSEFINSLFIEKNKKEKIINDLLNNWMCSEWRLSFIDAGRIPNDLTNGLPWTTNNFTERINRTIEAVYSGNQTSLTFVERMYGVKFYRETVTNESGPNIFESGLVTLFNTQTIEQVIFFFKKKKLNLKFDLNLLNFYYI